MSAVGIVPDISQQLRLRCTGGKDEWIPAQLHEDLLVGCALELTPLVEGLLIQHPDLVACAFEDHRLLHTVTGAGGVDLLLPGGRLGDGHIEHATEASQQVLEGVGSGTAAHLALIAVGAGEVRGQGELLTVLALVSQMLRDIPGGLRGLQEHTDGLGHDLLLLQDLLRIEDLQQGPLGVLRVLGDTDLLLGLGEVHGQGACDHRLTGTGGTDKQQMPALSRRDLRELDCLLLTEHTVEGVGGDLYLLGGRHRHDIVPGLYGSLLGHGNQ